MSYATEFEENGDEVLVFVEGSDFPLPTRYRTREVELAVLNMIAGHERSDLAISRRTLHYAVQRRRNYDTLWGSAFRRDPRQFSSTPRAT